MTWQGHIVCAILWIYNIYILVLTVAWGFRNFNEDEWLRSCVILIYIRAHVLKIMEDALLVDLSPNLLDKLCRNATLKKLLIKMNPHQKVPKVKRKMD